MSIPPLKRKTLAVIGAGPKGIAVAVKAKVLSEFGFTVDNVILIEKKGVAAHWSGDYGYTNGEMKLGTLPEKDLVFPIETDVGNDVINAHIHQRLLHFTWTSFLTQTKRYSDWIDRGRHAPCHKQWADYLQWVATQLAPEISIITSEVVQVDLTSDCNRWKLTLHEGDNGNRIIHSDKLMLTGPGKIQMDFIDESQCFPPSTYDLESFWDALKNKTFSASGKLAIIGAGENSASALLALSKYAPDLEVDIISPKGFIASRAESYYENQIYSHANKNNWSTLSIADRLEFIERTDLGVFSHHAMTILSEQVRHQIIPGRVISLTHDGKCVALEITYNQKKSIRYYDQVILATGFDQVAALKSLLTPIAQNALIHAISSPLNRQNLSEKIEVDLSVKGMCPYLYLPMLSGLMQGPGFANLSCLGLLSDRIVSYCDKNISSISPKKMIPYLLKASINE